MKTFFLLFAILFSASVLADCCNFEVESSSDQQCSTIDHDQNDGCGDETQHSESQHCHCSPINHLKIITSHKVILTVPFSLPAELIPVSEINLISHYETLIFQPPIA